MAALIEKIYKYDSAISYRLIDMRSHQWFRLMMMFSSKLGDGPSWVIMFLLVMVFGSGIGRRAVLLAAVSAVLCVGIFKAVKTAAGRQRPFETYPDLMIELTLPPPDKFSFPSGHSMNAFAIATVIAYYFPSLLIPLYTLAILIAASRVFLALHYPTDCIVGAFVGATVSAALILLAG